MLPTLPTLSRSWKTCIEQKKVSNEFVACKCPTFWLKCAKEETREVVQSTWIFLIHPTQHWYKRERIVYQWKPPVVSKTQHNKTMLAFSYYSMRVTHSTPRSIIHYLRSCLTSNMSLGTNSYHSQLHLEFLLFHCGYSSSHYKSGDWTSTL